MKRIIVLLICVAIVFTATGCAIGDLFNRGGSGGGKTAKTEITVNYDNVRFKHDNEVLKRLAEKLDVTFVYIDDLGPIETIITNVAAGNIPERIGDGVPVNVINSWIDQGIVIPLKIELLEQYAPKYMEWINYWTDGDPFRFSMRNGENYWQPVVWTLGRNVNTVGIRDDWLKNVGINSEPKTLDEFETVLDAFVNKDPNKSGKNDTFAISALDSQYFVTSIVWGAYDVYPGIFYERDGKIVFGDVQPETKEVLTILNRWYEAGYIDPEWMVNKRDNVIEKMVSDKVGAIESAWYTFIPAEAFYGGQYYEGLKGKNPDISFTVLGPVTGPGGKSGIIQTNPDRGGVLYTSVLKDHEDKIIKYLEEHELTSFDEYWMTMTRWGEEGVTFTYDPENGREWIPPYDDQAKRDEFGIGAITGTNFNDYEMQKKFMTAARYMDLRASVEYKSFGQFDLISPVERPEYAKVTADLTTYIESNIVNFINGKRSLTEFDDFVKGWYDLGGTAVMNEAQEVYEKYYK